MCKIKVKWAVSYDEGHLTVDLDEVGCETIEEWEELSEEEKYRRLQEVVDAYPEASYKMVVSYYVKY